MKYGLDFPPFGDLAHPGVVTDVAASAEEAGWDGVFIWDHIMYRAPVVAAGDPWTALAAVAAATDRVAIGPMVTPLARRRPHVLARQVTAIDQLSNGRFILGAGLGMDRSGRELSAFGEELDDRRRAGMLDEALDVLDGLWSGSRVTHRGDYYTADDVQFLPTPVQETMPVWLAARWPNRRPLRRAARWQGVFLIDQESPDQLRQVVEFVAIERGDISGFDFVVNRPYGTDPTPWRDAGATWFLTESPYTVSADEVHEVARAGPIR